MVIIHGGNGVSFLNEKVDYNYSDYESVRLMNPNIIVASRKDPIPYGGKKTAFVLGSGMITKVLQ